MIRKVLFLMVSMLLLSAVTARGAGRMPFTVFDGTTTNEYVPIYGWYCEEYLKCEYLIPAAELASLAGKNLYSVKWYLSTPAPDTWGDASFQVFIKEVEESSLSSYLGLDGATIVYEGSLDGTQSEIEIEFSTPYAYQGGNLLVGVYNVVKGSYKRCSFYGVEASSGACISGSNGNSLEGVSINDRKFLPKTTFMADANEGFIGVPTNLAATDVKTTSATLTWTPWGDETSWNVGYREQGEEQWIETTVNEPSLALTGLIPVTAYDFRVQAIMGENTGEWAISQFSTRSCDMSQVVSYRLTDSYGDGWNSAYLTVVNHATSEILQTLTIESGNKLEGSIVLCPGEYDFVWHKGKYDGECRALFTDESGEALYNRSDFEGVTDGTVLFSVVVGPKAPSDLTASEVTYQSATLSWTPTGEETAWQIAYGENDGFNPDADGVVLVNVTDTPSLLLEGLADATTYAAYVRAVTDEGNSAWAKCVFTTLEQFTSPTGLEVANVSFTTATASWTENEADSYSLRYREKKTLNEGFEGGTIPEGWKIVDANEDGFNWEIWQIGDLYVNNNYVAQRLDDSGNPYGFGNYCIRSASFVNNEGDLLPDNWLITPKVQLGGTVSFYTRAQDVDYPDDLIEVYVSTTGNNVEDFEPIDNGIISPQTSSLKKHEFDLSDYSGEGYIAIRHYDSNDAFYVDLDDFTVTAPEDAENPWTVIDPATTPCELTSLTPATLYEIEVRSNFADGSSRWKGTSFLTAAVDGAPEGLMADDITKSSADISWEGAHDSFNLRYRIAGQGFFEDFENELATAWSSYDDDDNDNTWGLGRASLPDNNGNPYFFGLRGYYSKSGGEEDNWLTSGELELGGTLSFWARGENIDQPEEVFDVYVLPSSASNDDDRVLLIPAIAATNVLTEYTADLSAYEGQTGRIIIHHLGGPSGLIVDNVKIDISAPGEWTTVDDVNSPYAIEDLATATEYEVQVQGVWQGEPSEWSQGVRFITKCSLEDVLAGVDTRTYDIGDDLLAIAKYGNAIYSTDCLGNWICLLLDNGDNPLEPGMHVTNALGTLQSKELAPTLIVQDYDYDGEAADMDSYIAKVDLSQDFEIPVPSQVVEFKGYFFNGKLRGYPNNLGQSLTLAGNTEYSMETGQRYRVVVGIELAEPWGDPASGAPRRLRASDYDYDFQNLRGVVLDYENITPTAINDLATDKNVKSVKYVNVTGQTSDKPFDGVNIVVTKYNDGTQKTTKVVY